MNSNTLRAILVISFGVLCSTLATSAAQVFTVNVPTPDTNIINSDSSRLVNTVGDVAGNSLFIFDHSRTVNIVGSPFSEYAGTQWVLVSGRGQILGARDFRSGSGIPIKIVFFSSRRILAQVDSGNGVFVEAFRPVNSQLVSEGLAVQMLLNNSVGEVTRETRQKPPEKFFDVAVSTNGKVTTIQRFDATRVRPLLN
jgi:hypothetical protein